MRSVARGDDKSSCGGVEGDAAMLRKSVSVGRLIPRLGAAPEGSKADDRGETADNSAGISLVVTVQQGLGDVA